VSKKVDESLIMLNDLEQSMKVFTPSPIKKHPEGHAKYSTMGFEEHSSISRHRSCNSTIMAGAGLLDFHRVAPATNRIVVGTPDTSLQTSNNNNNHPVVDQLMMEDDGDDFDQSVWSPTHF